MAEQPPTASSSTQKQNESPAYGSGVWISYKVGIRSRLRSLFHPVARFLRIMPHRSYDPLEEFKTLKDHKTGFAYVDGFYTSLLNLYKSAATCRIDRNRWRVSKISTYKSTHGVEHESLVAEVVCGEVIVYLRFERKLHKSRVGKLFAKSKATPKPQASDESDPSSDNATSPHNTPHPVVTRSLSKYASDEMTYSKVLASVTSNREECVEVIYFPEGNGLSLSQIAVLAHCVNSMGPGYSLIEENCYWFAYLMVETAKLIETDFVPEKMSKRKQGSWNNFFPTTKPKDVLIKQAKSLYDKKWDEFNQDIYDTVNNENSEIVQKERQKREEAERLEKEERQKREEAERLEKEERRKREEGEEEIKRLRAELAAARATNGANNSS